MPQWTTADIPPQAGKFAIVTGANSGIGYDTALELARAGAEVIVATRSAARGEAAVARLKTAVPDALVRFEALDLASLASVRDFAARIKASQGTLDILVNNAGVMALPRRRLTVDGFETQLGVNFLGHFLLTALLMPLLMKAEAPRVVQVSSIAHRRGRIALEDLQAVNSLQALARVPAVEAGDADVRPRTATPLGCGRLGPHQRRGASGHRRHRAGGERAG